MKIFYRKIYNFIKADKAVKGLDRALLAPINNISKEFKGEMVTKSNAVKKYFFEKVIFYSSIMFLVGLFIFGLTFYVINRISGSLQEIAKSLDKSSSNLNGSSILLSDKGSALKNAVSGQSAGLRQASASVDEINSMAKSNSDSAQLSLESSKKSMKILQNGKATVEEMKSSIDDISKGNNVLKNEMEKSNEEISKVITLISAIEGKTKVINDIVFQTKLLSFNASVEAARAGEHGKRFFCCC